MYEVLAPASTVGKINTITSVIKEPNRQEVRVRNSDIAKSGTKNKRGTELGQYIKRRPEKISEKKLERKITNNRRDLIRKDLGSMKIKRKKPADDVSVILSGRSCISTTSNVARALKIRIPKRNPEHDDAFTNRPDLTQILHFSPLVPLADPTNNPNTAGPSASQLASPQQPTSIFRRERTGKIQKTVSNTSDSDTSSVRRSKRTLKKPKKSTTSIVEKIQNTDGYSADIPVLDTKFIGEVSPRNPNEKWTTDHNPNLPKEMTVLEAETQAQSDSD